MKATVVAGTKGHFMVAVEANTDGPYLHILG